MFDAIEYSDDQKGISSDEFQMLKDLQTIFAKTGKNQGGTGYILDEDDAKIASEFASSNKNIKIFIQEKLAEINTPKKTQSVVENNEQAVQKTPVQETVVEEEAKEPPVVEENVTPQKIVITPESKAQSFNRAMQSSAKRYNAQELGFTQEVEIKSGMYLSNIAKKALQDEGVKNPTAKQLNDRIAQIVAMNPQIKDINNIAIGTKIKVGKGANDPALKNQDREVSPNNVRGTGTVPVEKPTSEYLSDSTKVVELLGEDGNKYADAVKDNPELKAELDKDYKYLIDKYNNDEYLTLDEQKIFDVLKKSLDADGKIITNNYPEKIKELEIPAESTPMTEIPDLTGYTSTTEEVPTGKDASGNDIKVTVTKYSKDGQPNVYEVHYNNPINGKERTITESSQEAVLKLKADLEAQALQKPEEGKALTAEEKRANLEKLIKIAELRPTEVMFEAIIDGLKDETLVDKNDPDAKALVQKLLLTRNGAVISNMVKDSDDETDNTLFENDPVALKTMAAMYKEIQAKEKAGERLTPKEIELKNILKAGFNSNYYKDSNDKNFCYDNAGLYSGDTWASNPQLSRDFDAKMKAAREDETKKQAVITKFINDPRTKEDENFRLYLACKTI